MSATSAADAGSLRSRRSARWLAALAFAAAALACFLLVFVVHVGPAMQLPSRRLAALLLTVGAIAGAAFFGQMFWAWLAARRGRSSWIGAVSAAVLTMPFANLTAWTALFVASALDGPPPAVRDGVSAWLAEIEQFGLLLGMLTTVSTIRFAPIAVPLAILASLAATLWYRRRLQRLDLPSYASPLEAGP